MSTNFFYKKLFFIILSLCFIGKIFSQRDTLKHRIFASTELTYSYFTGEKYGDKYFSSSAYKFQWAPYNFRTPSLGVGYLHRKKNLFLKTGLAFFLGEKKITHTNYSVSTSPQNNSNPGNHFPYLSNVGTIYYRNIDDFSGKVIFYNLDWDLNIGARIFNNVSLFIGLKNTFLLDYTIKGTINRESQKHSYNGPYTSATYIESEYIQFQDNEVKKIMPQILGGSRVYTAGINYTFKIKDKKLFTEFSAGYPFGYYSYSSVYACFNLKIGYIL